MKKIFNYILMLCAVLLAGHMIMSVASQTNMGTRWSQTTEGRTGLKSVINRKTESFSFGGNPVNSALLLDFRDDDEKMTMDAVDSWIYFDFEGRGRAVNTGWVGPGVGILVSAPGPDGRLDGRRKIFGNHLTGGDPRTSTGFEALAGLDENRDGLIDARDSGWAGLRIWLDKKPDGRLGLNELYRPEELKIVAFDLQAHPENRFLRNMNYLSSKSSFIYADGRRGPLNEVFFQRRSGRVEVRDGLTASPEAAALAPELPGGSRVRPLQVAITQSPVLARLFRRYKEAATRQEQLGLLDELLAAWARAGEAGPRPTLSERIGGRYDLVGNCLSDLRPDQLQRMEIMEAWTGYDFYRLPHELYPGQELLSGVEVGGQSGRELTITCPQDRWQAMFDSYDSLSQHIYVRLLESTRLKRYYDLADLGPQADFSAVLRLFEAEYALDPDRALTDLLEFYLDLARSKSTARAGRALDEYIENFVKHQEISPDQLMLYHQTRMGQRAIRATGRAQ